MHTCSSSMGWTRACIPSGTRTKNCYGPSLCRAEASAYSIVQEETEWPKMWSAEEDADQVKNWRQTVGDAIVVE